MYSEEDNTHLAEYNRCLKKNTKPVREWSQSKYGDEVHFINQLKQSSWRVKDKDSATLVVIPALLGLDVCRRQRDAFMASITPDQRHIVLSTFIKTVLHKVCPACIQIQMHTLPGPMRVNWPGRFTTGCKLISPMNSMLHQAKYGRDPGDISAKLIPWEKRRYAFYFGSRATERPGYEGRRRALAALSRVRDNVTSGDIATYVYFLANIPSDPHYMDRMLNTKFGIHYRGDCVTSNIFYELMEIESVPVIFSDGWYDRAPGLRIPWRDFTFTITDEDSSSHETFDKKLIDISNTPLEEVQRRLAMVRQFKPRVIWNMHGSKVAETLLIDARDLCLPGIQLNTSSANSSANLQ